MWRAHRRDTHMTDTDPVVAAAQLIKQLHQDHIKLIDDGFVFFKADESGVNQNVNEIMRAACIEQIGRCDELIAMGPRIPEHLKKPMVLQLTDAREFIEKTLADATAANRSMDLSMLPEVGNFDH